MSCALHKDFSEEACSGDAEADGAARFYMDLADGLHAMAQPLTVLLGALGVLTSNGGNETDHHRYLEISTRQVDRMSGLVFSMQQLVHARQFDPECSKINLWELLDPIVADQVFAQRDSDVEIRVVKLDRSVNVFGNAERTGQAFLAVLKVGVSVSSQGDVIQVSLQPRDGYFGLVVRNETSHGKRLSSSDRLSLSSAEANIRCQQGLYEFVEDPFCVLMALPRFVTVPDEIGPRSCQSASGICTSTLE
jgi:nitrogen-specific signal transduction histidine kinase